MILNFVDELIQIYQMTEMDSNHFDYWSACFELQSYLEFEELDVRRLRKESINFSESNSERKFTGQVHFRLFESFHSTLS